MKTKVKLLLFTSIFIASVLPILVSSFVLDEILNSTLSISFSDRIHQVVDSASTNLKTLGQLDVSNREKYKKEFLDLQDLSLVYSNRGVVRDEIQRSFLLYFAICCGFGLFVSIGLSLLVGRRVAKIYGEAYQELNIQREKNSFLENVAQWQDMAKRLAHEIKNPLTPIEFSLRNLRKNYDNLSIIEFRSQLDETTKIIGEEMSHLRNMVQNFSSFARLPEPKLESTDLKIFLADFESRYAKNWTEVKLTLDLQIEGAMLIPLDPSLLRQAFNNLLQNANEANPGQIVDVVIRLFIEEEEKILITIFNRGQKIQKENLEKIFEPYYSAGSGKENMGLGLAIVRKIIIDQGGDIRAVESTDGAQFEIQFPIKGEKVDFK